MSSKNNGDEIESLSGWVNESRRNEFLKRRYFDEISIINNLIKESEKMSKNNIYIIVRDPRKVDSDPETKIQVRLHSEPVPRDDKRKHTFLRWGYIGYLLGRSKDE